MGMASAFAWLLLAFFSTLPSSALGETRAGSFDALVTAVDRVDRAVKKRNSGGFPLSKVLSMLPDKTKQEFAQTFDSYPHQVLLSATSHEPKIASAVDTAMRFVEAHTEALSTMEMCLLAKFGNFSACDADSLLQTVTSRFLSEHVFKGTKMATFGVKAGRPVASGVGNNKQSLLARLVLWLSVALIHSLTLGMMLLRFPLASLTMSWVKQKLHLDEAEKRRRWATLTAVFPTVDAWLEANHHDSKLSNIIADLCDFHGDQNSEIAVVDLTDEEHIDFVRNCWQDHVESAQPVSLASGGMLLFIAETVAALLAVAILFRDGSLLEHCSALAITENDYVCTNGAFQGSLCALTCPNTLNADGSVERRRVLPRGASLMMVCGADGQWHGGPTKCLETSADVNTLDIPLLGHNLATR